MKPQHRNRFAYLFEIGKWALVVFLLSPLITFQAERMSLWRMMLGILLLVVFIGKMFYDFIIDNYKQRKESYRFWDLLILVGAITLIAVIIGGVLLFVGIYLVQQFSEADSG